MPPKITYELRIKIKDKLIYENVNSFLVSKGFDTFVEGVSEILDIHEDYKDPNYYESYLDQDLRSIYSFDLDSLKVLELDLKKEFLEQLENSIHEISTEEWTEGWKESFKPLQEGCFYVHPPWESKNEALTSIEIDPGMAFGTGSHETTRLCLRRLSEGEYLKNKQASVLDLGTGSGILAIACVKSGIKNVAAVDIDPNSILSAKENAIRNQVDFEVDTRTLSDFKDQSFDGILANILAHVLLGLLPELRRVLKKDGWCILSGILLEESEHFVQEAKKHGFKSEKIDSFNHWAQISLRKE